MSSQYLVKLPVEIGRLGCGGVPIVRHLRETLSQHTVSLDEFLQRIIMPLEHEGAARFVLIGQLLDARVAPGMRMLLLQHGGHGFLSMILVKPENMRRENCAPYAVSTADGTRPLVMIVW